jgi:FAD/FMN-containing dehydrogenase
LCRAVADFLGTDDYPRDGSTALLCEIDGMPAGVEERAARVAEVFRAEGATSVRRAAGDDERERIWRGRKSAFGAIGRLASRYYLHDCVVPRTKLAEVLGEVYAIADRHGLTVVNVFHAGDGNLHPLLVFDPEEGIDQRVDAAGREIVELCVQAGGVLTGEHGVGLEKREYMSLLFGPDDLEAQAKIPRAFDPDGLANPDKVFPRGSRCGDLRELASAEATASGLWI